MKRILSLALLLMFLAGSAFAQVTPAPSLLNFQGRLTRPDGTPVPDGNYSVRFSLWDAVAAGTEKWNLTVGSVTVRNGTFAVLLSGFAADTFSGDVWLEIKIGDEVPLTPRQQLVSVAYALKANTVPDGSIGANQIANGSITADKLASDTLNPLAWLLTGNNISNPGSQFLGTTNGQPLVFRTNNLERMLLTASGFLGIGPGVPGMSLEVTTPSYYNAPALGASAGGNYSYLHVSTGDHSLIWNNASAMRFGTETSRGNGYVERMRITGAGNVGIGTGSPLQTLDVNGRINVTNGVIQRGGTAVTATSDLGLYSQIGGNWMRFVTNAAPFQWYSDSGAGTNPIMTLSQGGALGLGTSGPGAKLDVRGAGIVNVFAGDRSPFGSSGFETDFNAPQTHAWFAEGGNHVFSVTAGGIVNVTSTGNLHSHVNVNSNSNIGTWLRLLNSTAGGRNWNLISSGSANGEGAGKLLFNDQTGGGTRMTIDQNGNVGIGTFSPTARLDVNGTTRTRMIEVIGGSDVAEPYHIAPAGDVQPLPGMVVSIDPNKVGQMRVAAKAHDKRVAGIISGANGIQPGITLRQEGTVADGTLPVASVGRVWCWCDADANGPIEPGDRLTTSKTPGHAMRVTNSAKADGAIIGKAMSSLKSGKGLVLVLVSLK